MSETMQKRWFLCAKAQPAADLRLFCLPHAGGSAVLYRNWAKLISPSVEVVSIQLPGRGTRLQEPPFTSMEPLVAAIAEEIADLLDKPFAFFGHSMGATIGFELAHSLRNTQGKEPSHLFVAGRKAPQAFDRDPPTYDLPEPEFVEKLRRLEGTPPEVVENEELLQLVLPLLRADFKLIQTYEYVLRTRLTCPVTALGGVADKGVDPESLRQWQKESSGTFSIHMFSGNHFFVRDAERAIVQTVEKHLRQSMAFR